MAQACAFAASGAKQQNVRDGHRTFLLDDAALDVLRWIRARMALDHARVLNRDRTLARIRGQHPPGFSAVASSHHADLVAFLDSGSGRCLFHSVSHRAHHTSGASETIFANFFSRSSRATGPTTRVPTGSLASLISTAALSSKRM